jgi:PIN domain nuclease of toxin-antitoxin system
VTYLDTHAAGEIYLGDVSAFSKAALAAIEDAEDLRLSPMVVLELEYLFEVKRVGSASAKVVAVLREIAGVTICDIPFPEVAHQALAERWTRDPFDRIIVAQARLNKATLITRDRHILKHYVHALA